MPHLRHQGGSWEEVAQNTQEAAVWAQNGQEGRGAGRERAGQALSLNRPFPALPSSYFQPSAQRLHPTAPPFPVPPWQVPLELLHQAGAALGGRSARHPLHRPGSDHQLLDDPDKTLRVESLDGSGRLGHGTATTSSSAGLAPTVGAGGPLFLSSSLHSPPHSHGATSSLHAPGDLTSPSSLGSEMGSPGMGAAFTAAQFFRAARNLLASPGLTADSAAPSPSPAAPAAGALHAAGQRVAQAQPQGGGEAESHATYSVTSTAITGTAAAAAAAAAGARGAQQHPGRPLPPALALQGVEHPQAGAALSPATPQPVVAGGPSVTDGPVTSEELLRVLGVLSQGRPELLPMLLAAAAAGSRDWTPTGASHGLAPPAPWAGAGSAAATPAGPAGPAAPPQAGLAAAFEGPDYSPLKAAPPPGARPGLAAASTGGAEEGGSQQQGTPLGAQAAGPMPLSVASLARSLAAAFEAVAVEAAEAEAGAHARGATGGPRTASGPALPVPLSLPLAGPGAQQFARTWPGPGDAAQGAAGAGGAEGAGSSSARSSPLVPRKLEEWLSDAVHTPPDHTGRLQVGHAHAQASPGGALPAGTQPRPMGSPAGHPSTSAAAGAAAAPMPFQQGQGQGLLASPAKDPAAAAEHHLVSAPVRPVMALVSLAGRYAIWL